MRSWADALQRFLRGDYAGAEVELQPLLLLPGGAGARALAWVGHADFFRGREADAESAYRRALEKDDSLWEARYQLGALAFAQGRHAEAADAFAQAVRLTPRLDEHPLGAVFGADPDRAQAQAQLYLGLSLRELGQPEPAEAALRASLQLNQGDPLAYGVLGDLLMAAGRYSEAAESYTLALAKVTDEQGLRSLRNDLGVAHFQAGALDKAAEAFKQVLKDKPDDSNALHNLGMLYLKQGLGEELRQDLREFLKAEKAEQLLLGLTRSLVEGARGQAGLEQGETGIVGRSQAVRDVLDLLRRAAGSDANVLLLGENGTGKELVARAIHRLGPRAKGAFVAVNCAALPENLLESELFGYEKGAFTGAVGSKPGRFELAAGGTLFLDEIGDLQPALQVKLLRAVQEKSFERVGGTRTLSSDFRLIAATHRDLRKAVVEGRFREDLFYRLFVIPIHLPPLRERADDIPLLAEHFLRRNASKAGKRFRRLSPASLQRLAAHAWPGNVRELENCIERAVAMHDAEVLEPQHLQFDALKVAPAALARPSNVVTDDQPSNWSPLEAAERRTILDQLHASDKKVDVAAVRLGMSRATLYRKIGKYKLDSLNSEK